MGAVSPEKGRLGVSSAAMQGDAGAVPLGFSAQLSPPLLPGAWRSFPGGGSSSAGPRRGASAAAGAAQIGAGSLTHLGGAGASPVPISVFLRVDLVRWDSGRPFRRFKGFVLAGDCGSPTCCGGSDGAGMLMLLHGMMFVSVDFGIPA